MADSPGTQPSPHRRRNPIVAGLQALVRTRVTTGLLVVLPVYVTILLVRFVFDLMRGSSQWLVDAYLSSRAGEWVRRSLLNIDLNELRERLGHTPSSEELYDALPAFFQWGVGIVSVLLTIVILYAIGLFAANIVGRRVIELYERILDRLPLVKTVYGATKQVLEAFAGDHRQGFQRVALIPFPDARMRAVGFVTNNVIDHVTQQELVTIFIPTTPNPTTGFFQILPRTEITELDWSVEDAFRAIVSGGILTPAGITLVPNGMRPTTTSGAVSPASPQLARTAPPEGPTS